jgi:hypothetical protein
MAELVITRPDGSARRVAGYKASAPAADVPRFTGGKISSLPPRVDLRPGLTQVENQGQTSSCVANAVAGAYEYLVKRHRGDDAYDVSRLFIYYNARKISGTEAEDGGSQIQDAIAGLKEFGACSEASWPFDEGAVNAEPEGNAYDEAAAFLVEHTEAVPVELASWKHALAEGHPIVFGILLFESFDAQRKKGLVPLPSTREGSRESHGAHAMLCVGYSDKDQVFVVRNSWGTSWGDDGYCYIPYAYVMNPKFNLGDSWIIKQLENFDVDANTWTSDDESFLPDLNSELAQMTDEEHSALLDAMGDVPLETRIALIFLAAAGADESFSEQEVAEVAAHMESVMQALGSDLDPQKVLAFAAKHAADTELLNETVALLGEHLSQGFLAGIVNEAMAIAASDELDASEEDLLAQLVDAWQIAGDGEEAEDEEEEEDQ